MTSSADGTLRASSRTSTRVAFLTQWYAPEPVSLPGWIASGLRRRGLSVHVVTGIPNYPTGTVQPGWSAWRRSTEVRDGVPVTRSPLVPSHNASAAGRATNYASFALTSSMVGRRVLRSCDVALVYGSPVTAVTAAWATGTPYVVLVQDLWPDSVFATGFLTDGRARKLAENVLGKFSLEAYARAAHVCVITPGMRDLLISRGIPAERISVVYNWVDEAVMRPVPRDAAIRRTLGIDERAFLITYAGTLGPAQDLDNALEAMARLSGTDVHLLLLGAGISTPSLQRRIQEMRLEDRVHLRPPVDAAGIPAIVAASDLNLVSLADDPLFHITLPSKVQTTLACGGPVLVCAPGDAGRLVTEAEAGIAVRPGDPGALADAMLAASKLPRDTLVEMGRSACAYYEAHLSETINATALATLLAAAARPERPHRRA